MTTTPLRRPSRTFHGTVVSKKMDKTITVVVTRTKLHPKYKKRYTRTTKFLVHDEQNRFQVGQPVTFRECRPLSRLKRWRVVDSTPIA